MTPRLTTENYANLARVNPEQVGYFSLVKAIAFKLKDVGNVLVFKLGAGVLRTLGSSYLYAKCVYRVTAVFGASDKLKVIKPIVGLDAVDMVDLERRLDGSIKSFPYQSMHLKHLLSTALAEVNSVVSIMGNARLANRVSTRVLDRVSSHYPSHAGGFIKSFVTSYRHPKFCHSLVRTIPSANTLA